MGDSDDCVHAMAMVGCEKRSGFVSVAICRNDSSVDTRRMVAAVIPFVQRDMVVAIDIIVGCYGGCDGGTMLLGHALSAMAFLVKGGDMDGTGRRRDGCVCCDW